MRKITTIFTGIALSFMLLSSTTTELKEIQSTTVYVCNGKYATKYHYKKNCRGLNNCKSSVSSKSETDAKKSGRTLCGWEK